jgi:AcrR family transcriptional regulator
MRCMSTPYQDAGRTGQKRRTFQALVAAAREAVAAGRTPTVDDAAAAAGVARSTAYRYFPSQRELLAAAHPETGRASLLPPDAPDDDAAGRLDAVVSEFTRLIVDTEAQQRTMLRLSLEPVKADVPLPLRQGRAIAWIEESLQPLRKGLTDAEVRSLTLAIRSAIGIEALVWLTDIGGLTRDQAVASMRWSAQALLQQALAAGPPSGS